MDECFKNYFLYVKKSEGQTYTQPFFPPFFWVYYIEGRQTVTRADKLVAWGRDFILRLGFFGLYSIFFKKKLNSNQHFKSCSSDLEMEISGTLLRIWISGSSSPSFLQGRSWLNCWCHYPFIDYVNYQFIKTELAKFAIEEKKKTEYMHVTAKGLQNYSGFSLYLYWIKVIVVGYYPTLNKWSATVQSVLLVHWAYSHVLFFSF